MVVWVFGLVVGIFVVSVCCGFGGFFIIFLVVKVLEVWVGVMLLCYYIFVDDELIFCWYVGMCGCCLLSWIWCEVCYVL